MSYLLQNNLIGNKQYGFISGRSLLLQLQHICWMIGQTALKREDRLMLSIVTFRKLLTKYPIKD